MADSRRLFATLIVLTVLSVLVAGGGSASREDRGLAHPFTLDPRGFSSGGGLFDSHPALEEGIRRLRDLIPSESGA